VIRIAIYVNVIKMAICMDKIKEQNIDTANNDILKWKRALDNQIEFLSVLMPIAKMLSKYPTTQEGMRWDNTEGHFDKFKESQNFPAFQEELEKTIAITQFHIKTCKEQLSYAKQRQHGAYYLLSDN